jgi:ribonuclease-3
LAGATWPPEALIHRSALDRQPDLKEAFPSGNERLEFLGDRVLSLASPTLPAAPLSARA